MVIAPPDVLIFPSLFPRSKDLDQQSSFVSLHVYLDGLWTTHSQHPEIGGGTWNRRPAPAWTLWRIRNNQESQVGDVGDGEIFWEFCWEFPWENMGKMAVFDGKP